VHLKKKQTAGPFVQKKKKKIMTTYDKVKSNLPRSLLVHGFFTLALDAKLLGPLMESLAKLFIWFVGVIVIEFVIEWTIECAAYVRLLLAHHVALIPRRRQQVAARQYNLRRR
jgi:hypothetical protein